MTYDYDIFISYGHVDDEDPGGDVKGWVDLLVERLPGVMAGYLGYKPKIWRDEQSLPRYTVLQEAIGHGINRSYLLVPIVSPRYALSDWCKKELDAFCAAPPPPGADAYHSRIFKVIKTPLVQPHLADKEPALLRDLIGYPFYEMQGDMPREFSPDVKPEKDQRYWDTLRRLAWDLTTVLVALKHPTPGQKKPEPPPPTPRGNNGEEAAPEPADPPAPTSQPAPTKFVYLAETTSDLSDERARVRDELRQRGYGVLPENKLPLEEKKKLQEVVSAHLARCALSVHLVGARYGSTPEDDASSVVCIQEELASSRGESEPSFQRLLWMPPGLNAAGAELGDERQKKFVEGLQGRISAGAELLQTSLEDLKTRIIEKLTPAARPVSRRTKLKQVYLICENRDRSFVRPIKEFLFKQKLEVITWFEGDEGAEKLADYHRKNLKDCDAALIYFGNGDEPWVRKNLEDLEKAYGYGREDDWTTSAVYVGAPASEQKEEFLTHMVPLVIRNFKGFNPEDLRDFVQAVCESEGGRP